MQYTDLSNAGLAIEMVRMTDMVGNPYSFINLMRGDEGVAVRIDEKMADLIEKFMRHETIALPPSKQPKT